jgi:Permuted papain-like amidase enzyme, YaeF/YiiX, C92 family
MNNKTILFSLIIVCSVFLYCLFFLDDQSVSELDAPVVLQKTFDGQFEEFTRAVEAMLVWRVESIEFHEAITKTETLSARELRIIQNEGSKDYLNLRNVLLNIIDKYKHVSDLNTSITISTESATGETIEQANLLTDKLDYTYVINPNDAEGINNIVRAKMALAATFILYDNYVISIARAQENKKLRHIINLYLEGEKDNQLERVSENFGSINNFNRVKRVIPYALEMLAWEEEHPDSKLSQDSMNQYLNTLIQQSYSFEKLPELNFIDVAKWNFSRLLQDINDELKQGSGTTMHQLSKFFGNTMGLYESRKGKLYDMTDKEHDEIVNNLKPLDILLEKTPFRLTDKFIPGHWGHVAIWMGSEPELKELGIWDSLDSEHQDAIRNGNSVLEALRPGVQLNTFRHFLNIDDFAVLRLQENYLDHETLKRYLLNGFEQVGKEYDFNFDVETLDKIVCSETAYVVYDDKHWNWPTSTALGRATISPDNVAEKVIGVSVSSATKLEGQPFETTILYHDGMRIENNLGVAFNHLMNQRYNEVVDLALSEE